MDIHLEIYCDLHGELVKMDRWHQIFATDPPARRKRQSKTMIRWTSAMGRDRYMAAIPQGKTLGVRQL